MWAALRRIGHRRNRRDQQATSHRVIDHGATNDEATGHGPATPGTVSHRDTGTNNPRSYAPQRPGHPTGRPFAAGRVACQPGRVPYPNQRLLPGGGPERGPTNQGPTNHGPADRWPANHWPVNQQPTDRGMLVGAHRAGNVPSQPAPPRHPAAPRQPDPTSLPDPVPRQPDPSRHPAAGRPVTGQPVTGQPVTGGGYARLRPWRIRDRRFALRWRGLDPGEVYGFLDHVADDMAAVYADLAAARKENQRIKDALRQWQTEQAPNAYDLAAGDWVTGRATTAHQHGPDRHPVNQYRPDHHLTDHPGPDRHPAGRRGPDRLVRR